MSDEVKGQGLDDGFREAITTILRNERFGEHVSTVLTLLEDLQLRTKSALSTLDGPDWEELAGRTSFGVSSVLRAYTKSKSIPTSSSEAAAPVGTDNEDEAEKLSSSKSRQQQTFRPPRAGLPTSRSGRHSRH